jgi:hypothetical protein
MILIYRTYSVRLQTVYVDSVADSVSLEMEVAKRWQDLHFLTGDTKGGYAKPVKTPGRDERECVKNGCACAMDSLGKLSVLAEHSREECSRSTTSTLSFFVTCFSRPNA